MLLQAGGLVTAYEFCSTKYMEWRVEKLIHYRNRFAGAMGNTGKKWKFGDVKCP